MRQFSPQVNYLRTAIETASPTKRVVMLYDGAIRYLSLALPAMRTKNYGEQSLQIGRAQAIIAHLRSSFDRSVSEELADCLNEVYVPLFDMLTDANIRDDDMKLEKVIEALRELRDAWAEVDRLSRIEKAGLQDARQMAA